MADDGTDVEVRGLGGVRRFALAPDVALLEAFLGAGLPAPYRCRQARCGRCRVFVAGGGERLAPPGEAERRRLGEATERGLRLLCQARLGPPRPEGGQHLIIEY